MPRRRPTSAELDAVFLGYRELQATRDTWIARVKKQKKLIVSLCRRYGITPAKAEKTLRLEAIEFLADATFGTSTRHDQAAIDFVADRLMRLGYPPSFFKRMFDQSVTYKPRPVWRDLIMRLSNRRHQVALLSAMHRVTTCTPCEPSLKVTRRVVTAGRRPKSLGRELLGAVGSGRKPASRRRAA
jgi:hypothetical protein